MGGLTFQDEDPLWIQHMEALDERRGYTPDDVNFRVARSQATTHIRQALRRNEHRAPGKSLLAQNSVKVDMTGIDKYEGSAKPKDIEKLAHQMTDFFEMTNLLGPDAEVDRQRVLLLGSRLSGAAREFYNTKVSGKVDEWSFVEVIQAIEAQFLPLTLYETARARFDRFMQRSDETVLQAYTRLKEYNDAVLYEMSPYDMKYRFFHGLKPEIRGQLAHDDCTPEKNRWKIRDMLKMAINIEDGLNKARPRSNVVNRPDNRNQNAPARPPANPNWRRDPIPRRPQAKFVDTPQREREGKPSPVKQNPIAAKSPAGPVRDKSNDICRNCGKKGHWADTCWSKPVYRGNMIVEDSPEDPDGDAAPVEASELLADPESNPEPMDNGPSENGNSDIGALNEEDYSSGNYSPGANAMTVYELDEPTMKVYRAQNLDDEGQLLHRNRARTKNGATNAFGSSISECISGYIPIGSGKAHVLIDTGSEVQLVSADYARSANIHVQRLVTPVGLQLATSGSRATINHGCETIMKVGSRTINTYWDVGKLDYFDAVLGIQALRALGCNIDAGKNEVSLPDGSLLIDQDNLVHPVQSTVPIRRPMRAPQVALVGELDSGSPLRPLGSPKSTCSDAGSSATVKVAETH
jgi:hypothetical protein